MTEEEWSATGIRHIEISSAGRVRDAWTGNIRKTYLNERGIVKVHIRHTMQLDRMYSLPVAKLVLTAFEGVDPDPTVNTPLHLDGDLTNCRIENLRWAPLWEAKRYYKSLR